MRRQLEPGIVGRRIEAARVLDERWSRPESPRRLERQLAGRRVDAVERRGKYLLLRLEGERTLAMHLRMTGNLLLRPADDGPAGATPGADSAREPAEPVIDLMEHQPLGGPRLDESHPDARHLCAVLELDDGAELWFTDARRFGHATVMADRELEPYFRARLGIEPLSAELTPEALSRVAAGRTAPLKSFLLTQTGVAGIGNIYADEALFRARLHPLSPAGSMRLEHCEDLVEGIVGALEAGLASGGASIDDYRDTRGEAGAMQDEFLVHTREDLPCPRCGDAIRRIVVSGRSTYFSPGCQKRLRRRRRTASGRKAATRIRTR